MCTPDTYVLVEHHASLLWICIRLLASSLSWQLFSRCCNKAVVICALSEEMLKGNGYSGLKTIFCENFRAQEFCAVLLYESWHTMQAFFVHLSYFQGRSIYACASRELCGCPKGVYILLVMYTEEIAFRYS